MSGLARSIALIFLAAALVFGCVGPEASAENLRKTTFKFADGLIWVEVAIPGRYEPLHFLFDTGAGATVLNLSTARELGLSLGRSLRVQGPQGHTTARVIHRFHGTLVGIPLPERVLAIDLGSPSQACHCRIDGLVGADFLAGRVIRLDYSARSLWLESTGDTLSRDAFTVPLERRNDAWCVPARISGRPRNWIRVDTGYDGGLSWWPGAGGPPRQNDPTVGLSTDPGHSPGRRAPRVIPSESSASDSASSTDMSAAMAELDLSLGDTPIGNMETTLLRHPLFKGEHGLLGNEFLLHYEVTLDFAHGLLVLAPPKMRSAGAAVCPVQSMRSR